MNGLTARTIAIVKAKLSKVLDRAEHPAETLDYSYQRQVGHLQDVKRGIVDVITAKKRLQIQAQTLMQHIERLDAQAHRALGGGRDDLARAAVAQKALSRRELDTLTAHIEELERQNEQLVETEKRLRHRLEAFRARKEVIKAQYTAAEAQVRIGEAATGVGRELADVGAAIQRAEDKTATLRARAAAVEELEAAGTLVDLTELEPRSEVERELAQLDLDGVIEAELEQMKAGLARPAPAALEEGRR
jgi:phage shock protein A